MKTTISPAKPGRSRNGESRAEDARLKPDAKQGKMARMPKPSSDPDTSTYSGRMAERLRELRNAKGLTVSELAAKLAAHPHSGIDPGSGDPEAAASARIRHYESGRVAIPPDLYPVFAKLLGVTVREFFPAK